MTPPVMQRIERDREQGVLLWQVALWGQGGVLAIAISADPAELFKRIVPALSHVIGHDLGVSVQPIYFEDCSEERLAAIVTLPREKPLRQETIDENWVWLEPFGPALVEEMRDQLVIEKKPRRKRKKEVVE